MKADNAFAFGMNCAAYASTDCSGSELGNQDADEGSPYGNGWVPLDTSTPWTLPGGTASVQCELRALIPVRRDALQPGGANVLLWVDNVYFGPGTTPVSLQGFSVD
ncbi:hypothetical protein [Dokdonella sp.]|uniref:hypothetical protein n=1 Tax=Dokdonella sp. TaxID=2291710 RepID=UPI0025BB07F2|nr:hypothetical protein [Dokdonella sp.]